MEVEKLIPSLALLTNKIQGGKWNAMQASTYHLQIHSLLIYSSVIYPSIHLSIHPSTYSPYTHYLSIHLPFCKKCDKCPFLSQELCQPLRIQKLCKKFHLDSLGHLGVWHFCLILEDISSEFLILIQPSSRCIN